MEIKNLFLQLFYELEIILMHQYTTNYDSNDKKFDRQLHRINPLL